MFKVLIRTKKVPKELLNNVDKEFHAWPQSVSKSKLSISWYLSRKNWNTKRRTKINPQIAWKLNVSSVTKSREFKIQVPNFSIYTWLYQCSLERPRRHPIELGTLFVRTALSFTPVFWVFRCLCACIQKPISDRAHLQGLDPDCYETLPSGESFESRAVDMRLLMFKDFRGKVTSTKSIKSER